MGAMTSYLVTQGFGQSYLIWVVNFHVFFTQLIFQLLIAKAISIQRVVLILCTAGGKN